MVLNMKKIGASFYDELVVHGGLIGEHFTWQDTGYIEFFHDTPPSVVEAVNHVYENHDPGIPSVFEVSEKLAKLMADAKLRTDGLSDAFVAGLLSDQEVSRFKAWATYQVALIGISDQPGYPRTIDWPTPPEI